MKSLLYIGNNLRSTNTTVLRDLSSCLKNEGYRVVVSSEKENQILRLFDMLWSILRYCKKVDYVLIDTYSTKNFYYALLSSQLCRLLKIKYIPILHGGNLPIRLSKSPRLSSLIFSYSFKNIAPSNYLKVIFETSGFKVVFIPNSIEIEQYNFKQRLNLQPKLLFVRSFSIIYNPKLAIEVFKKIKEKYPHASLCMIGPDKDGSLEQCVKLAKDYGLTDAIEFTGMLPKKIWHKKAEAYDIFINTTDFDNTPVSVLEAMALGLPVVSTNVGGIPYLLSDHKNALLVKKNDPEAMFEAIDKLLNSSGLVREMSTNAREKVCSFDWEIVKKQWIELFNH